MLVTSDLHGVFPLTSGENCLSDRALWSTKVRPDSNSVTHMIMNFHDLCLYNVLDPGSSSLVPNQQ